MSGNHTFLPTRFFLVAAANGSLCVPTIGHSTWRTGTQRQGLHEQILELGPVVDDLAHESTFRLDRKVEAPHLLKGAAHQVIAVATAAQRQWHLGVEYRHEVSGDTVVRDGDTGRRIHLEPVQLRIVANGIRLHQGLITGLMTRPPTAQTSPRIPRSSLSGPLIQQLLRESRKRWLPHHESASVLF